MSKGDVGSGPIPNRWLHCPRKSETIIAERFLAFKTPLSSAFNNQMPIECVFPPEMIFGYCKTLKLKLGLWIDLTNTKRFYSRDVVESRGAQYVKLQCRGHGETPSPEQTQSFIEIVDNFITERPFDIIAVHCTHGFNRTGFLIASYLVERLDCSVEAALAIFAKARPPGIYKQDYINELFRRYEDEEDATAAPELPDWCLEYDDSNSNGRKRRYEESAHSSNSEEARAARAGYSNCSYEQRGAEQEKTEGDAGDQVVNGITKEADVREGEHRSSKKGFKKRRGELFVENATFMEGIPGVVWVKDQPRLGELQLKVQQMCGWDNSGFPGAQPVSMDQNNIKRLQEIPYRVSWKADGTRYMMLINGRNEIYFFDRNNSCFQVENLTFPKLRNLQEHLEDTLIDGEMVVDKYQGQKIPRYLVYDVIKISNFDIGQRPFFPDRLNCIEGEIIGARIKAFRKGIIDRASEPFGVRTKQFYDIRASASLLGEKFAQRLSHEPDGLIFQPSKQPYMAGVCNDVLKWKPLHMNSVDFRLKIVTESAPGCLRGKVGQLYVTGCNNPIGTITVTKAIRNLDNRIIECTVNQQGQWEFMRERTDKTLPNTYKTAMAVIESIRYPVTKEILLNFIAERGYRKDDDAMPPPPTNRSNTPNAQQQFRPPPPPPPPAPH